MKPDEPITSVSLFGRLFAGSRREIDRAWADFVKRYFPVIWGWFKHFGAADPDAEDFTQEILRSLYQNLKSYNRQIGGFRPWLYRIIENFYKTAKTKRANQFWNRRNSIDGGFLDPPSADDLYERLKKEFDLELLYMAIEKVSKEHPETWRTAVAYWGTDLSFVLHDTPPEAQPAAKRTTREVAESLGISSDLVYQHSSRVLEALRKEIRFQQGEPISGESL